jgi:hypothetical protein
MRARLCAVLAAILVAGCGGEEEAAIEVSTEPLAGRIGGQAWTFAQGDTDALLSEGEPDLFTRLHAASYDACGFAPSGDRLILSVPKQPGDYAFSTQQNGTFVVGGTDNLVATRGRLIVESVDGSTVTARVHMIFDTGNEVDGRFTATICP